MEDLPDPKSDEYFHYIKANSDPVDDYLNKQCIRLEPEKEHVLR